MKTTALTLLLCLLVAFCAAQNISTYSIITTGSVLKGGANGNIILTQPMYQKLAVDQGALKTNEAVKLPSAVKVYPNPFNGTVTLIADMKKEGRMQVYVYNMLGAKVWDGIEVSFSAGINQHPIDLNGLKAGIYFLKAVTGENNSETIIKLIKQ